MGNKDLKIQDPNNERIGEMIAGLRRVEAPGDFDFGVRARIAQGRPSTVLGSWLPASVKLALPLALVLVIGGYVGFNAIYSPGNINVPVVADGQPSIAQPVAVSESQPVAAEPVVERAEVRPEQTEVRPTTNQPVRETAAPEIESSQPEGGSVDFGATVPRKIYPRGFDPNVRVTANSRPVERSLGARDIFNIIGIDASYSDGGWKVRSVSAGNLAGRSGVRAGDVIEAVNGQVLGENTAFGSTFSGSSVRVRRDGAILTINLRP